MGKTIHISKNEDGSIQFLDQGLVTHSIVTYKTNPMIIAKMQCSLQHLMFAVEDALVGNQINQALFNA